MTAVGADCEDQWAGHTDLPCVTKQCARVPRPKLGIIKFQIWLLAKPTDTVSSLLRNHYCIAQQRLRAVTNRLCKRLCIRLLAIMQVLRATSKWMQCLRSSARPTRCACRSAHKPGTAQGSMYMHVNLKGPRKAFQNTVTPKAVFYRASNSYAASVTPSESIEVDVLVEGSNQVLDRCNRMYHELQRLHPTSIHGKSKSSSLSQTGN